MLFVYSGIFLAQVEKNQFGLLRLTMGINPENFRWKLTPGASFTAPEVVLTYSDHGIGQMTRNYHDMYRKQLIRGEYKEPEMISPDSKLYEKHSDWAIQIPGRVASLGRNQYVLDLSRKEVRDYVYNCVADILHSANIEYVKWDMNRQLSDIGSAVLAADEQGELFHRYVLGVYELQERLIHEFPYLLL